MPENIFVHIDLKGKIFFVGQLWLHERNGRQSALRFSTTLEGPFLTTTSDRHIPPLIHLGKLLNASNRIITHTELDQDLQDMVEPGSSLGGARPKAAVLDADARKIAKQVAIINKT